MPEVPKLSWCLLAYITVHFFIGVAMKIDGSYETLSLLELGREGLWWLMLTHVFFFLMAPWTHQSWIAPVIMILVPAAMIFAGIRLNGSIRLVAILALLLCLNAYSICVVALTGG
jgi:hypothetical protein